MKYILIVFLFISSITTWATGIDTIDYATLINLRDSDQRKFIDSIQQMSVDLDGMFLKDEITEKKYVHFKTILNNLLLSSAYAQDDVIKHKELIKGVDGKNNVNLCIFGGWISLMGKAQEGGKIQENKKSTCMSPNYIKYYLVENASLIYKRLGYTNQNQAPEAVKTLLNEIAKNHPEQDGVNSDCRSLEKSKEPSTTVCNPTLFGKYPDRKEGENLICVSANDKGNAHNNISMACKIKADKIKKDTNRSKKYYEKLQSSLGENNISEFVNLFTNSCFCDAEDATIHGVSLNTKYIARMQQGRTCYAWMYQMKDVLNNATASTCRALKGKLNGKQSQLELTQNLFNIINKIEDEPKFSPNGGYDETDKEWNKVLSSENQFNKCPIEFENKPNTPVIAKPECEVNTSKLPEITFSLDGGKDLGIDYEFKIDDVIKIGKKATLNDSGSIVINVGENYKEYTSAKAFIKKGDEKIQCEIELPEPEAKECKAGFDNDIATINFDGENDLVVKISLNDTDLGSSVIKNKTASIEIIPDKYTNSDVREATVEINDANSKQVSTCKLQLPKEEEQELPVDENVEYSISLELGDREGKHQEVKAVVKKGDEVVKLDDESLKINWYVTENKNKKKKKKKKDDEVVNRDEQKVDEIKGMDLLQGNSVDLDKKFLTSLDKREVQAVLIKDEKKVSEDKIDIPPNSPRKPATKISPRLKTPNLKQRYKSSEGVGIHRGIR